ncbi:MAG: 4Fe-4S dicluster domain-containing protein [Candidatus Aminicenantes bacterium]|nr:4Fe-4S dicluster domain-containing protein [Candidatus Aminicenantes bacterium]
MDILKITKKDFLSFVDKKISEKKSRIVGVVKKGSRYAFDDLAEAKDLQLDYDVTILPPKKYFQPPKEVLLKFVPKDPASYTAVEDNEPITIIGVHYYDLAGIYMMDRAFSEGEADKHYLGKRENSLLIGLYPTKPFKYRFSKSVVKDQFHKVADLMLIDMGDDFAVEVVSAKGKAFMVGSKVTKSDFTLKDIETAKNRVKDDQKIPVAVEISPEYLSRNFRHPAWDYFGDKCFSCGSCVLVCPTCYCFDVREEVELSLAQGERIRVWDGCMLEDFALVADGHNFRKERGSRFRHRIFRKGKYLPEQYRYYGCVGCGRCADACTADIAGPVKVFKYMLENQ